MTESQPTPPRQYRLYQGQALPCPYLPGQVMGTHFIVDPGGPGYRVLMDHGFRRSGRFAYRPDCGACQACVPLRVAVDTFTPRRDQRRIAQRNRDLRLQSGDSGGQKKRDDLYQRYEIAIHQRPPAAFVRNVSSDLQHPVTDPPSDTDSDTDLGHAPGPGGNVPGALLEAYGPDDTLLAVSVIDIFPDALSSVYCYWEPTQAQRGLGTFMALAEIDLARTWGLAWWYPGYWVDGCAAMAYKRRYQPQEKLQDGQWIPAPLTDSA